MAIPVRISFASDDPLVRTFQRIASALENAADSIQDIAVAMQDEPAPHATSLGVTASVQPETEGPSPPGGHEMFTIQCRLPKHVLVTVAPNGPLQAAPEVKVDNDATVTPDPSNPGTGKGPFQYRVYGANPDGTTPFSFTPSNVSVKGDADPDPAIDEDITDTGIITWEQPHASSLGVGAVTED